MRLLTTLLGLLWLFPLSCLADEFDDEFEFDFRVKPKSTLQDFPMQEVDSEALSNTAIAGALQATSSGAQEETGKPAYTKEAEITNKRKQGEINLSNEPLNEDDILRFSQGAPELILPPQEPFKIPDGREITHHVFEAFER